MISDHEIVMHRDRATLNFHKNPKVELFLKGYGDFHFWFYVAQDRNTTWARFLKWWRG